jgi:hypothetical protein
VADPVAHYFVGLDLGQVSDYSALAVVERKLLPGPLRRGQPQGPPVRHHAVRHLQRWALGTSYPAIVEDVAALLARPPLPGCLLVADQTGVGRAVVDLLRQRRLPARLMAATITAGDRVGGTKGGAVSVPKKELVSALQAALQTRRLEIAPVPEAETLGRELTTFRVKITAAANETFAAWRERDHDDLVLATALAVWAAEREPLPQLPRFPGGGLQLPPSPLAELGPW